MLREGQAPSDIVGFTDRGQPVYVIAGGSEQQDPAAGGGSGTPASAQQQQQDPTGGQAPAGAPEITDAELDQLFDSDPGDIPEPVRPLVEKLRKGGAKYRTERKQLNEFIEKHGGREYVERIVGSTYSPEGLKWLIREGSKALNLPVEEIEALLEGKPRSPQAGAPDPDDDQPVTLTRKQLEALVDERAKKAVEPVTATRQQDLVRQGQKIVTDTLSRLDVDDDDQGWIIERAKQYGPREGAPDEFDPQVLASAIEKAHQDFVGLAKRFGSNYTERKKQANQSPGGLGGAAAPAFALREEPRSARDADRMLREMENKGAM